MILLGLCFCVANTAQAKNALSYVNSKTKKLDEPDYERLAALLDDQANADSATVDAEIMLPEVELLSFTSEVEENSVAINWITLKESNTDLFTIEKSKDGKTWTEVMNVSGNGNTVDLSTYSIVDEDPFIGTSFYRIKNNSINSSIKNYYIATISVFNPEIPVEIRSNLVIDWLDVKSNSDELYDLTVRDNQGECVMQKVKIHLRKEERIVVNVNELPKGVYTLKTATQTRKFYKI